VLRAEGDRQARILQAEGQAKAIRTVFNAIHTADPDPKVMAYQYLQSLPAIAAGQANKVWIVPAELTRALEGIGGAVGGMFSGGGERRESDADRAAALEDVESEAREVAEAAARAAADAAGEVRRAERSSGAGTPRGLPASEGTSASTLLGNGGREPEKHIERA
jgi:hypothetical protein